MSSQFVCANRLVGGWWEGDGVWEGRHGSLAHNYGFRTTENGPLPARPFPSPFPLLLAVDCES